MLQGQVALVTGGGSGIGRATALAFSQEGIKVVVADISIQGGEQTVEMIKQAGGEAFFIKTDVSKADEVETLVRKSVETYSQLDYAFNNAGIEGEQATTADYPVSEWKRLISINLTSVVLSPLQALSSPTSKRLRLSTLSQLFHLTMFHPRPTIQGMENRGRN